ncbi:hypothetical protein VTJ49DRAFT_5208 [Mycothermus thermophilus]|uniref:N-acetyltransferase domain-containing protein n=1 Tax=Humicola insolens TaxID=85995 RepID=A0ABR3VLV6_HUMIN
MHLRLATKADLEALTAVLIGASPDDPVYSYHFPDRHLYPNEFADLCRRKCAEYLDTSTVTVCEMEYSSSSSTTTTTGRRAGPTCIVAFAVFDMPFTPSRRRSSVSASSLSDNGGIAVEDGLGTGLPAEPSSPTSSTFPSAPTTIGHATRQAAFRATLAEQRAKLFDNRYRSLGGHVFLRLLVTHPSWRRRGAGTALAKWGVERAREMGVHATVFASPMGVGLYRRLGFREVGRFRVNVDGDREFLEIPALALAPGDSQPPQEPTQNVSNKAPQAEPGAMERRLQEATEEALLTGGRAGRRAIEEAGFSEELKARLLDKVAGAQFNHEHSATLAQAGITSRIPESAGAGTRATATAAPWTGEESTHDAVLRMLDDAKKPLPPGLRGPSKASAPPIDLRLRREPVLSAGQRAAGARERAQAYAGLALKDKGLTDEEREAMKREFQERFSPGARAMPNTISGLAALANERIEEAIARGQFKNIPRGPGVERDNRADNPFIDTTEYIMNKMIKRQDLVPPWIDKQQELAREADNFRKRLREDWKRHAARMISAAGGTLEQKMARAEAYARAEQVHNPRRRNPEQISVPTNVTDDAVMAQAMKAPSPTSESPESASAAPSSTAPSSSKAGSAAPPDQIITRPFRDPAWEAAESAYMKLAIDNLNALTRSYNLMAPDLAKKPYFSLERELRSCFADVAPQLAEEIRRHATKPAPRGDWFSQYKGPNTSQGLFGSGVSESRISVVESKEKQYGFREFWRDLFTK